MDVTVAPASGTLSAPKDDRAVFADFLSQAITGELVGMANYAAMVRLHRDPEGQCEALAHAAIERGHAERFRRAARDLGVEPIVDIEAPYWRRVREAFLRHADNGDRVACLIIQEVMLESFAVSAYRSLALIAPARLAQVFADIAAEEAEHIDHAIEELRPVLAADREAFEVRVEALNGEVMSVLAEMLVEKDTAGHCGLCRGSCVKGSMSQVGLHRAALRGEAISTYLRTLDRIGVRGERSIAWVARLPI